VRDEAGTAGALGAAVRDQRDVAQARRQRRQSVVEVGDEGAAPDLRGIRIAGRQAEIFRQAQRRHEELEAGGEHPVDIPQRQAGVGDGPRRGQRHRVGGPVRHDRDTRLADPDDGRGSAQGSAHGASSTGSNTG